MVWKPMKKTRKGRSNLALLRWLSGKIDKNGYALPLPHQSIYVTAKEVAEFLQVKEVTARSRLDYLRKQELVMAVKEDGKGILYFTDSPNRMHSRINDPSEDQITLDGYKIEE